MNDDTRDFIAPSSHLDITVCYRMYPRISKHPFYPFPDKLALARLGLESFKQGLGNLQARVYVLLDNCPPAYERMVRETLLSEGVELIHLPGIGNRNTFALQVDVLSRQRSADLVFFAEDDYLYLPNSIETMVEFFKANPEVVFATPYDHADYTRLRIHRTGHSRTMRMEAQRWHTVTSTCLTFMARHDALVQNADIMRSYQKGNSDLGLWLALTKRTIFNPFAILASMFDGRFCFASHYFAWRYGLRQILKGRRYDLWAPTPSLATHMDSQGLAPGIDWVQIFRKRAQELESGSHSGAR